MSKLMQLTGVRVKHFLGRRACGVLKVSVLQAGLVVCKPLLQHFCGHKLLQMN